MKLWSWLKRLFHRKEIDWEAERAGYSQQADYLDKLTPEEEKDVAIAKTEIATGKAKSFDNVDDFLDDLRRTRPVPATRQDIGKFMKHGKQLPYYRRSVKVKVQPEEDEQ